jgi:predicted nucleotide-binding protein
MKPTLLALDKIENILPLMESAIANSSSIETLVTYGRLKEWSEYLKNILPEEFVKKNFADFDRHLHFVDYYLQKKDFEWVKSNFDDIKKNLPVLKSKIVDSLESGTTISKAIPKKFSNKIFIVHGKDFKAVKELKTLLESKGLEPIVLHEKASGSRTIIEKLEKHSDVGFAFVLLTPDDAGYCQYERLYSDYMDIKKLPTLKNLCALTSKEHEVTIAETMKAFVPALKGRARQNVVLEFGYFIGLLGRDRVCCLHQGNVELPSDMTGIVYIHFDKTLKECRQKILQELTEANYSLKDTKSDNDSSKEHTAKESHPSVNYEITQKITNTQIQRILPDVGFDMTNLTDKCLKVWVKIRVKLGGKDLGLIDGYNRGGEYIGYYDGKTAWNLNPHLAIYGHFSLPSECIDPKYADLTLVVSITFERAGKKFDNLPLAWTYLRNTNSWFIEPSGY